MCPVALTDTVTVTYTAALENGEVVDQEYKEKPATLSIGSGILCKAVEACLFGMEPGQNRIIRVEPEDAYGPHIKELVQEIPLDNFKGALAPEAGMIVSLNVQRDGENHQVPATVIKKNDASITVDYNHPLAGRIIVYNVTLVGINS